MFNREIVNSHNQIHEQVESDVLRHIEHKLRLDEGEIMDPSIRDSIVREIWQGTQASVLDLQIPIPDFDLIYGWNGDPASGIKDGRKVLADLLFHNGNGIIRFSPSYLESYSLFLESGFHISRDPSPRQISMHETRHFWQWISNPSQMTLDLGIMKAHGFDGWIRTESEIDAVGYSASMEAKFK